MKTTILDSLKAIDANIDGIALRIPAAIHIDSATKNELMRLGVPYIVCPNACLLEIIPRDKLT